MVCPAGQPMQMHGVSQSCMHTVWLLPASQGSDFVTACMLYISLGLALMYLGNHHDCLITMHRGFCTIMLHYYSDDHNIHSILLSEDHFFEIHSTQYYTIITEKKYAMTQLCTH